MIAADTIGTFDGMDIYSTALNGLQYFLILNPDKTYKGYIAVKPGCLFNEAYVTESNRRRGICSILILFILRKLNKKLTLAADEIITDDSRRLFFKLSQTNKITVTSENKPINIETLGKIFAGTEDNDLTLVIEGLSRNESETRNEILNPITGYAISESITFGDTARGAHWYD